MGSDALPASRRLSGVVFFALETRSWSACSLASYSSWISGVSPTPGVVSVLVQASHVRYSFSPSTRVAHSTAACGEVQVWHERLLQLAGAMDEVSVQQRDRKSVV